MSGYKSPEQLEQEANALIERHQKGELPDDAYADDDEGALEYADGEQPEGAVKEVSTDGDDDGASAGDDKGKAGHQSGQATGQEFDTEGLDKVSQNRVRAAQARMHRATQAEAAARRENEDLRLRLEALGQEPNKQVQKAEQTVPTVKIPDIEGMTEEEATKLADDYPDFANVFKTVRGLQEVNTALRKQVDGIDESARSARKSVDSMAERTATEDFMGAIRKVHSDADEIQGSDEWLGWVDNQPQYVQRAVFDGATSKDMVQIISAYKRDTGKPVPGAKPQSTAAAPEGDVDESDEQSAPQPQSKLEQARQAAAPSLPKAARQHKPGQGKGKLISRRDIAARENDYEFLLSDEGEKWQKEIMKAMSEGRITD
jgi:hypothetical protein